MFYRLPAVVALLPLVLGQMSPAPVITDNQYGSAFYVPLIQGVGTVVGTFDFKASTQGVNIAFNVNGFNVSDDTTYTYHIHEKPVPLDGNCNATGEHFDPFHVGAAHKCDPLQPDLCQLGDLSGKHGAITVDLSAPVFSMAYQDYFLSTIPDHTAFFANLSIVVHRKRDSLRLNCGNFIQYGYPVLSTGVTEASANISTTMYTNNTIPTSLTATSAVSTESNATGSVAPVNTPTLSNPTQSSTLPSSKTSSDMSVRTGSYGSGPIKASLLLLGITVVISVTIS